jgi:hypothetical protein
MGERAPDKALKRRSSELEISDWKGNAKAKRKAKGTKHGKRTHRKHPPFASRM